MAKKRHHFKPTFGGGSPVFKCQVCERNTRDSGQGIDHLCAQCFEIAGIDNMVNDYGYKPGMPAYDDVRKQCDALLAAAVKLGSDGDKIKASNEFIWGQDPAPTPPVEPAALPDPGAGIRATTMAEFERASARNDVINWMDDSIAMHERTIRDLKQRKQRFLEAFDKPEAGLMTAVDHVSAFVNDMQNGVLRNVRFDLAASVAAKVTNVINGG